MSADGDTSLVADAARNNAELCDAVCRSHGGAGVFASDAWTSPHRTPELYPDAVTLDPNARAEQILARLDRSPGASVKDSFGTLDLRADGFRVLFSAEWIARTVGPSTAADADSGIRWSAVVDADALTAWEVAWSEDGVWTGRFRPELLAERDLVIMRGDVGEELVAGFILNRSERVVGISNLFTSIGELGAAIVGAQVECSTRFPGSEIVGYESGEMLTAARLAGFRSIAPLRVWIKD